MQPSIAVDTVLQNRYRILSIIGQGGFGRTYLAEDQGRFKERCALKEFIPPQGSSYALNKAKELFQREAAILYQIQHPQIPQFRATFEENQRLFLVQDYVDGKTFRALLNERKAKGITFSEAEILQLIRQILPILHHIHGKGIIHRDIAPDNIMLRQQDGLPVLIDFGVVKEIATRVQSPETNAEPTTVGKFGYAPSEQMQTGRAYPSSDLYALAVTSLVLLTGREPQELYDDRSLTWNWQRWATLSPAVAQVFNRMLSYRPSDRYSSAAEVAQALQAATGTAANTVAVNAPTPNGTATRGATAVSNPVPVPPPASAPDVSQMQTMAVGRAAPPPTASSSSPNRSVQRAAPSIPRSSGSGWDNPLTIILTAMGVAVVAGIASWAIVSALRNANQFASDPTPTSTPTPTISASATPTPTPTPSLSPSPAAPTEYSQSIGDRLKPNGETVTYQGNLRSNETITYVIPVEQGQTLSASLEGEGVLLTVLAPSRDPVVERVPSWQGTLDFNGDYAVRLSPVKGLPESDFRVNFSLQPVPSPTPTEPSPPPIDTLPPADPQINEQGLDLPPGEPIEFSGNVNEGLIQRYLVDVLPGEVLEVRLLNGDAALTVRYPDGRPVEGGSDVRDWSGLVLERGRYQIDVGAGAATSFSLRVLLDNRPR
ncbi:serine/threonine protein kinase [Phormidium tenue FACHB-886]|nr:serine/threonine protein kinase [Phormidium tenue FACHB-886]